MEMFCRAKYLRRDNAVQRSRKRKPPKKGRLRRTIKMARIEIRKALSICRSAKRVRQVLSAFRIGVGARSNLVFHALRKLVLSTIKGCFEISAGLWFFFVKRGAKQLEFEKVKLVHGGERAKGVRRTRTLLRITNRRLFACFLREVSGKIAMKVVGSAKGRAAGEKFLMAPFTRIVEWGVAFVKACGYVEMNLLESTGAVSYTPRKPNKAIATESLRRKNQLRT